MRQRAGLRRVHRCGLGRPAARYYLRTELGNQFQQQLKQHFPQALAWLGSALETRPACAVLRKWNTLAALQAARPSQIRSLLNANGARGGEWLEKMMRELRLAQPLTGDVPTLEAGALLVQALTAQLRTLADSIAQFDRQIAAAFAAHPDAHLYCNLPGAGKVLAPRLLVAFGSDREKFASAADVQNLSGIAPITQRSGKRCVVQCRWACPTFLRQTFHEFAGWSIRYCRWAGLLYQRARAAGQSHNVAVRNVAFKWIRVLYACWRDRRPYDEARYEAVLLRRAPAKWTNLAAVGNR